MSKRFVSWATVSSEEQAKKVSLDEQKKINREHIARWQGTLIDELEIHDSRSIALFEDAARRYSAYARLKQLIDNKSFDVLIFWDSSRLGRIHSLVSAVCALCELAGIQLYETTSPPATIDAPIGTLDSRMLNAIKGVMSHNEIDKLVQRSAMGRRARAKKGKHSGRPPFGYKVTHDDLGNSRVIVNEEEAKIVRHFYELYLVHGRSLKAICDEFAALGYVSPRSKNPWVPGNIRLMLLNRWAYAGYVVWGQYSDKEESFRVKAEWEAIITEEMAHRVEKHRIERAATRRAVSSDNRFSMVAKCQVCGSTMAVHGHVGIDRQAHNTYSCTKRCPSSRIREYLMFEAVETAIAHLEQYASLEALIGETPSHYDALKARHEEMLRQLDQIRNQRRELTMVYTRGTISLDEYEGMMADLYERQSTFGRVAAELEQQIADTPTAEDRRTRLEEVRNSGMAMLYHGDIQTSNTWLCEHFLLYVKDFDVQKVEYL